MGDSDFAVTLDYVLIKRKTRGLYEENIDQVFLRIEKYGFKLRKGCQFFLNSIKYLGQIIDAMQIQFGRALLKYTSSLYECYDVTVISRAYKSYNLYVLNMNKLKAPPNELLKKFNIELIGVSKSFDRIKEILTSDLSLMHYDLNGEVLRSSVRCE